MPVFREEGKAGFCAVDCGETDRHGIDDAAVEREETTGDSRDVTAKYPSKKRYLGGTNNLPVSHSMGTSKQNTDRIGHQLDLICRRHSTTSAVSLRSCITYSVQTDGKPIAQPSGSREFNIPLRRTLLIGPPTCNREKEPNGIQTQRERNKLAELQTSNPLPNRLFASTTETSSFSRTNRTHNFQNPSRSRTPETSQ